MHLLPASRARLARVGTMLDMRSKHFSQAFSGNEGGLSHFDVAVNFVSSQLAVAISALVRHSGSAPISVKQAPRFVGLSK
eukprot:scaffold312945_cov37-Prasinocladus_malaysianus.AAC.1